jgi:hypothetical protein
MASGATAAVGVLAQTAPLPFGKPRSVLVPTSKPVNSPLGARPNVAAAPQAGDLGIDRARAALSTVNPQLLRKALASIDRHAKMIKATDRIAIVDFSVSSSQPRMHLLDVANGKATQILVAHGSGSDPHHTGLLEKFSNAFGSNASSEGAFVTEDYYVGKHGRSQRLIGLDPTNSNALDRAVVVHSAWYANDDMIKAHGKLGRSQGCFAVGENKLDDVFSFLGKGRMIFASRA